MAKYILGQYNHKINANENWIQPLKSTTAVSLFSIVQVQTPLDLNVGGSANTDSMIVEGFEDTALRFNDAASFNTFALGKTYYCHCKIKRLDISIQRFSIKLVNSALDATNKNVYSLTDAEFEQYIKTINVQQSANNEWVDVEFIFTPQAENFNTILFNLTRTAEDFIATSKRTPIIAFLEVSEIQNIISVITKSTSNINPPLLKMGIQSRPGLKMCINREEISVGRTGIYEIKNGEIKVNFLSFIAPATDKTNDELNADLSRPNKTLLYINEVPDKRSYDGFTIDYIYDNIE